MTRQARQEDRSERRGEEGEGGKEGERRGGKEEGRGGLRAAHLARTQLARQCECNTSAASSAIAGQREKKRRDGGEGRNGGEG